MQLLHFSGGFGFAALLVPVGVVALVQLIGYLLYTQTLACQQYGEVIQQIACLVDKVLIGTVGGLDYGLNSLFANLRGTMDTLDALSDELSDNGSALTADLRAVNDQMNVVVNLCLDIFVDMTDADASSRQSVPRHLCGYDGCRRLGYF